MKVLNRRVLPSQAAKVRTDLKRMLEQIKSGDKLNLGDRGPAVAALQRHLYAAGVYTGSASGTFDEATEAALKTLQKHLKLEVTGEVDRKTFEGVKKLNVFVKDEFKTAAKVGQRGSDILRAEKMLERAGFRPGAVDGIFDAKTAAALARFRKSDKDVPDKGSTLDANLFKNLKEEAKSYDHDAYRRRDIEKSVKPHKRLDDATAKAAAKGDGVTVGAKGRAVANIEKHLEAAGYDVGARDAKFTARTEAAVKAFQRAKGLPETGVVDAKTWSRLRGSLFAATSATSPAQRLGEISSAVKRTENMLKKLGYKVGSVDGKFTENTQKAVLRFQRKHKLNDTGAVGGGTLNAIKKAYDKKFGGVSLSELRRIMPDLPLSKAKAYLPHLNRAMVEFKINTPKRQAAFLAQLAHESVQLRYFEEIASGAAYEGRRDLGNIYPGDGVRYKGRGPIQLTGRANYRTAGRALGLNLEKYPKKAATAAVGFRIAGWYWSTRGLNGLADAGNFREITRRINGGYNGLSDRLNYWARAKRVLM